MVNYKDFLLAYEIRTYYGTRVEFELKHVASALIEFLEMNPVYISSQDVEVLYMGSRLILEPRNSPSGLPQGIILPQLHFKPKLEGTSERSNRLTVDRMPQPDLRTSRKNESIPASTTLRDEWSIENFDSITFRTEREAIEYVSGICRTMSELMQAFITTFDTKNRAITLIINN